jgi:hypothetical protein
MKKINKKLLNHINDEKYTDKTINKKITFGDIKSLIISAMIHMGEQFDSPLEDWQINDIKNHYFNDWVNEKNMKTILKEAIQRMKKNRDNENN